MEKDNRTSSENYIQDLRRDVLNENRMVFVQTEKWQRIIVDQEYPEDEEGNVRDVAMLPFLSVLMPCAFDNATIMASNIEMSLHHPWFDAHGTVPREHAITKRLAFRRYPNEMVDRLRAFYAWEKPISKKRRDTMMEDDRTALEWVEDVLAKEVDGHRFGLVTNDDYATRNGRLHMVGDDLCERISTSSHGQNQYRHLDRIVFLAATNRYPNQLNMLRALGFSSE